jgi:hypothetical protein
MNQRHVEFFGPDLARGPFSPHRMDAAAIQIATALAQLRAPLTRADNDILDHGDFIRQLADRIAPDYAAYIKIDVGQEVSNSVQTTIRTELGTYSMLDLWLADNYGGGLTSLAPTTVTFNAGTVLQAVVANKHYRVITSATGIIDVTVSYAGVRDWYWGISRHGRGYYSARLDFN